MLLPRWFKNCLKIFGIHLHRLYYFEKDLRQPIEFVESPLKIQIKKASKEDVDELMQLIDEKEKKRTKGFLKRNNICYIARSEGRIIGYSWISTKEILVDNVHMGNVAEKGSFSFNGFVFPEFRGKKVFKKIITAYCEDLRNQGYKFISNLANINNIPSIKARENLNSKRKWIWIILLPFGLHMTINGPMGQGKLIK